MLKIVQLYALKTDTYKSDVLVDENPICSSIQITRTAINVYFKTNYNYGKQGK